MNTGTLNSGSNHSEPAWVGQVLHYWFEELDQQRWFDPSHEVDALIRARFLALHEHIASGQVTPVMTPRALLAAVIVLDQFSRNMFRGTPRAYASESTQAEPGLRAVICRMQPSRCLCAEPLSVR